MTKAQQAKKAAAWWRKLGNRYERKKDKGVCSCGDVNCTVDSWTDSDLNGICDQLDSLGALPAIGTYPFDLFRPNNVIPDDDGCDREYWWDLDADGFAARALTCYFIAAMIEAGDVNQRGDSPKRRYND